MDRPFARKRNLARLRKNAADGDTAGDADSRAPHDEPDAAPPNAGCLVLEVSQDGTICNVVDGSNTAIELPAGQLVGKSIDDIWPLEFCDQLRTNIKRTLRTRQVKSTEIEEPESGRFFEFIFVTRGRDRVLTVVRDVSASVIEMGRIQALAYIDKITGLPNREHLHEQLQTITDLSRIKESRASVICIEIDQVDLQNAASGSMMQDALLSELAMRLTENLRGANDPNPIDQERYSIAARTDFRQFTIVLPKIESGSDAIAVAKRITGALTQPIDIGEKHYKVGVHVGIALFPQDGTDSRTLMENSRSAMLDAKTDRSAEYKFHSGTVRLRALQRQDLELELRSALDNEDLDLNYLPIIDARTGVVVSIEALLRWPAAIFGTQPIEQIITLAEKTGLIVPIGQWVLRKACEQLARWHAAGHPGLRLAVNLSIQDMSRPDLAANIAETLANASLDPRFLDVELTEQCLYRDSLKDFRACLSLKKIGVGITVDDYGTGVCSLAQLSESPVDAVKIDNSLVAQLNAGPASRAACAAAAAMARELGYTVIAEGVETEEQAELLRGQGCGYLQGFAFGRPMFAEDLDVFLQDHSTSLELLEEQ